MKNKKAFTLIELLAVILILGIIALIAIPQVNNIIVESRKGNFKTTAQNIVKSISDKCSTEGISDNSVTTSYYISGGTATPSLDIKGKLPNDGIANVSSSCDVEIVLNSDKYCAIKNYEEDDVEIGKISNDNCILSDGTSVESPIASTPSSCFIYNESGVITGYHFEDTNCPNKINIPDKIDGTTITSIGDGAFVDGYDYILYSNDETGVMDIATNYESFTAAFVATYGFAPTLDYIVPVSDVDSVQKECRATPQSAPVLKPLNYQITGSDGFAFCDIDWDDIENNIVYSTNITSVNFGNAKNLNSIGKFAFFGNTIQSVQFGSIPIQTIDVSAFDQNNITGNLYLNKLNNLTTIGGCAFYNSSIENLYLPSSLDKIGYSTFYGNSISNIEFNGGTNYIGNGAFEENLLSNLVISDSTKYIGYGTFYDNNITTLKLGNSLEYIDEYAFYDLNISSLEIPDSVEYIGTRAFMNNNITSLKLGSSLTTIGHEAFNTAGNITDLVIPNSVTLIDVGAFGNSGIVNLNLGTGVTRINNWAFYNNKITSLVIPNSLTILEHDSFYINKISSLTIGSGLTSITGRAFASNLLTTVNIPSTVTTIAGDSFSSNASLLTINIYKTSGSITNSPWGAGSATINWLG